jgi:hypothetical protein
MTKTFIASDVAFRRFGLEGRIEFDTRPFRFIHISTFMLSDGTSGVPYKGGCLELTFLGLSFIFTAALLGKGHRFAEYYFNRKKGK